MAEHTAPGTRGASPGAPQTATNSTGTRSSSLVGRVREQTTNQLNTQKNRATDGLGSVVHAVRGTSQKLREERHDTVARYVDQAANQIERFSNGLRQRDVGELMNDAQRFARERPALFVGSAFAAGLLGARFLKSSSQPDRGRAREAEYRVEGTARARLDTPGAQGTAGTYGSTPMQGSATASTRRPRSSAVTSGEKDYPPTEGM